MVSPLPHAKVLEWLGTDSKGVPYYLHPLNLVWSDTGVEHDLGIFRRVADELAKDRIFWAAIIRDPSWRECLAGCTCLLASRKRDFFDELCFRFRMGSFIAPQIAVALGLLHGASARSFLESMLDEPSSQQRPKEVVSAHRVLERLGIHPVRKISIDAWPVIERDNAILADKVVAEHWDFWQPRV